MTAEPDLTWYEVVVEFALDHSDPACPSREDVFDAFVDTTPEGLVDASHSMGPADGEAVRATTVPAPTPDEDGVYQVIPPLVMVHTMSYADHPGYAEVKLFLGTWSTLTPLESERLGAVLLAAAQDARRLASSDVAKPRKPEETPDV